MSEVTYENIQLIYDDTLPCVNVPRRSPGPTTWHSHSGGGLTSEERSARYLKRNGQVFHNLDQRGIMSNLGLTISSPQYKRGEK